VIERDQYKNRAMPAPLIAPPMTAYCEPGIPGLASERLSGMTGFRFSSTRLRSSSRTSGVAIGLPSKLIEVRAANTAALPCVWSGGMTNRNAGWRVGPHLGQRRVGRHERRVDDWPRIDPPPPTEPSRGREVIRKRALREEGVVLGYNGVDHWGFIRPKFAPEAKAIVTGAEILDGGTLRPGQRVSFEIEIGARGQLLARRVERLS